MVSPAALEQRQNSGINASKLLRALFSPQVLARRLIRTLGLGSLELRLAMQALVRAEYAFGVLQSIYLASRLNQARVSVIEFGVATGSGLRCLERYAAELGQKYGVFVEVYGFDTGVGLPPPTDYRDVPYLWRTGDYKMNFEVLQSQLKTAKLVLGDVRETVPQFIHNRPAPIGFISFDLDFYSSTVAAFKIFDAPDESFLPRVICYFDDVGSDGRALLCDYVGELLAIREFNERPANHHKLCQLHMQEPLMKYPADWLEKLWVYHRFLHPQYNMYLPD